MNSETKKRYLPIGLFGMIVVVLLIVAAQFETVAKAETEAVDSIVYLPITVRDTAFETNPIFFGTQVYGSLSGSSFVFDHILSTRTGSLRNNVYWDRAEPVNVPTSQINWTRIDNQVRPATADADYRNMIIAIENAPAWAADKPDSVLHPDNVDDFAEFVGALVERYDGDGIDDAPGNPKILYWEFYNEPDGSADGTDGRWGIYGDQYATMLKAVYPAVKAANPQAKVVFGGLAYDWFDTEGGVFVESFLTDVLDAGGGDYFDVMNIHAYPSFAPRWTSNQGPGLLAKLQAVRSVLETYGVGDKPFVVSEAGWHSNANSNPALDSTDEIQARYLVQIFAEAKASGFVDFVIWWMMWDTCPVYPFCNGLFDANKQPKLSHQAFEAQVDKIGNAEFVRVLPDSETGLEIVEAFEFFNTFTDSTVYIAWLNPIRTTETRILQLPGSEVVVSSMYGTVLETVRDADDGVSDGKVSVTIGGQPIYVEKSQ